MKALKGIVNVKIKLSNSLRPKMLGAALLLAGSMLSGAAAAQVQAIDGIAAIVNDDVIMRSQFQQRVKEVTNAIRNQGAEAPPTEVLNQQILERLILDSIQLQMGERAGIQISDEELNNSIEMIAQSNGLSVAQFQQALTEDGLSLAEAREQIRKEMIISRVRQYRVSERIQVSDQEVKNFLASDLGKIQLGDEYHLANILIPLPDAPTQKDLQAAEQKVQEVMGKLEQGTDFARLAIQFSASENALQGGDMGWRKAVQLPSPLDQQIGQMQVGQVTQPARTAGGIVLIKLLDKRSLEASTREETLVRHILIKPSAIRSPEEAKQLVQRIYDRLQNGEDFAELAKNFSEDPGSALNGGSLNWIDPDVLVPEFRETMASAPINAISKPFSTQFGWHVLQVLDRRTTDSSTQAREQQALNILRNRKFEEEVQTWLRQIRDEAYVDIKI